jgi:hypothetical protein
MSNPDQQKLIEPDPRDIVPVSYPDTLDGWLAAWVLRRVALKHRIPMEMVRSGAMLADIPADDRNYIELRDFSGGAAIYERPYRSSYRSALVFLRGEFAPPAQFEQAPPVPFGDWERTFPFGIKTLVAGAPTAVVQAEAALCRQVWEFFHADRKGFDKTPRLIQFVDDHVRGRYAFSDTKAVIACVESYPADFFTLDELVKACDDRPRREMIIVGGQAILRYREKHGLS